jgi:dTDP-4-amino-4,6-dideoxygalactose transaminase
MNGDTLQTKISIGYPGSGAVFDEEDARALASRAMEIAQGQDSFYPQPEQSLFCDSLQKITGGKYVVPLSSCGTALDCVMALSGIDENAEVITTPLTFVATAGSALLRGARVVFADIERSSLNLDPASVRSRINERTKAIVPVHFAGNPCDVEAFEQISRETGIPVFYDAAHALGASWGGKPIGEFGTANCFSFQFNKHVTCLGEGGAIVCEDEEFASKASLFKSFGFRYPSSSSYEGGVVETIGTNFQLPKLQLLAGHLQFKKFEIHQQRRRNIFLRLRAALEQIEEIELPEFDVANHACLLFVIRLSRRMPIRSSAPLRELLLKDFGIETRVHYKPIWEWPLFQKRGYSGDGCPEAAAAAHELITLPVSVHTTDSQCDYIVDSLKNCLARLGAANRTDSARTKDRDYENAH